MSGWKEYELQDVVEKFIDYRGKTPEKTSTGIPLVTAKIVKNGKIQPPDEFIAAENFTAWMCRGYPEINDVVMTTEAPLGEVALLKDKNVALAQRIIVIRGKQELCDNAFLKYYLQSPYGQEKLQGRASGTTVEGIKASELRKIIVSLPPLPEQRAIAGVLSSLDDKIDLLYRQNKTLEGMAEALWRKMFVEEADPGWKKGKLGDMIDLSYGKGLKETVRTNGHYPVIGSSGIVGSHNEYLVKGPGIVIGRKGTLGKVNYLFENFYPIDTTYYVISKMNSKGLYYEYFLLKEVDFSEMNTDSAVPGLNRDIALSQEIIIPTVDSIHTFNNYCDSLFQKLRKNEIQIHTLSIMRDSLLPKLMSGEVRVKL